ncbi:M48 family metalloprotease [Xylophilus sp. GOD-11R]|uniref:M48 family metalloprotease n=1 Tax=Xylophilus sp. GOD-11R TaxID=3089814 RepID=UPI00298C2190|nr:M48 family metalloprotease [Xylophilus sp. GOD-11R]WPB56865.1 M48 family metalloprotease [Xylophilus sp. GOD-11R]
MHFPKATSAFRSLLCTALCFCFAVAPSHAQLPSLGDGADMPAGEERRLGDRIARELYRDPDFVDDPILVEYVQGIWDRLMVAAVARGELNSELDERFAWRILLGRDRSVNAFALPGGYMGVLCGLIAVVGSKDELASVLAHEMSHVTQRHISRLMAQQSRTSPLFLAGMVLGALAASRNPQAANAVITGGVALQAQSQLNFSRAMEREADRVGYLVMTQAGFDGRGFAGMFEKLQQASGFNDSGGYPYLRSHPLTSERIADMRSRMPLGSGDANRAPTGSIEDAIMSARARIVSRPGQDALRGWSAEPDMTGFDRQPDRRRAAALYAAALSDSERRDLPAARAHVARLAALVVNDAAASRLARLLAAEIEVAAGNGAQAVAALGPLSSSLTRPELVLLAQASQHGAVVPTLTDRLQSWLATHPQDGTAWTLIAAAYRAENQPLRALRADAEAQVAHLDWSGAVDRYKAGQEWMRRNPGGSADYMEVSIIDARLQQAQSRLREETAER